MLEICQSQKMSIGVQQGAWLLCEVAGEVRHGQDRGVCLGLFATGTHGFQRPITECRRRRPCAGRFIGEGLPLSLLSEAHVVRSESQAVRTLVICHTRELAHLAHEKHTSRCCREQQLCSSKSLDGPRYQIKHEFERFAKYFPAARKRRATGCLG